MAARPEVNEGSRASASCGGRVLSDIVKRRSLRVCCSAEVECSSRTPGAVALIGWGMVRKDCVTTTMVRSGVVLALA